MQLKADSRLLIIRGPGFTYFLKQFQTPQEEKSVDNRTCEV